MVQSVCLFAGFQKKLWNCLLLLEMTSTHRYLGHDRGLKMLYYRRGHENIYFLNDLFLIETLISKMNQLPQQSDTCGELKGTINTSEIIRRKNM